MAEPKIRIETREELIFLLAEAAAIEHNLMCCYLYAAWSLKRGERDGLTPEQAEAVNRWRAIITSVATEEMTHLTLACNLATAIGAGPHLSRPNFPIEPGYHASGVVAELAPFSAAALDHFIFLERPEGKALRDSTEFVHPADYHRTQPKERLMPSAQDYLTVGGLYRGIRHGMMVLAHHLGESELFCGDPASQIGPAEASLPELMVVRDLETADEAIETIIEQGEGAPDHHAEGHYARFLQVRDEFNRLWSADPSFEPAFPCAHNPTMNAPLDPAHRVHINAPEAARVLDLANSIYGHTLRCLVQAWGRGSDGADRRLYVDAAIDLMMLLDAVGIHLASLPAGPDHPGVNAGVTFTMLRDVARLPPGPGEKQVMAERLVEIAHHARRLFPEQHELASLAGAVERIADRFGLETIKTIAGTRQKAPAPSSAATEPPAAGAVETAEGRDLVVRFDGTRCIHARFCVLGAPNVFKANTPGTWIFPDAMDTEALVRVLSRCPSGALSYRRKDNGPPEQPPPVNLLNVRENGPNAFRGALRVAGREVGFRATLCRCGASKNKPFCDNSHKSLPFVATGEPETRESEPLAARDGPLVIEPQKDGPLEVSGNLEICSGTGRTIDRVTRARLCRCGGSRNKPFCDNTHLRIGFKSG
jgi:CDGSH-type Zn-finger protein/uncharacterized Fe-S cluster protein YjdI